MLEAQTQVLQDSGVILHGGSSLHYHGTISDASSAEQ